METAAILNEIDLIVAGMCLLAGLTLFLYWRQRHQHIALHRLQARLERERATREQAEQALADTRRQVCHLSASQQSLRDAERRRIARDLHDDLGQHLLTLGMELRALGASQPALVEIVDRIDGHVQNTVRAMRCVVRDLQPEALENGLEAAVNGQLAQFSRLSGIPCQLDVQPEVFDNRDAGVEKMIYRILQESLSNIARHAHATQVSVAIARAANRLDLTVQDNGVGMPASPLPACRTGVRVGLRGIAERVAEAGGRFDVASTPGQGTALTMSFPLTTIH
ncbi:histidine kinase [Duganella sp. Leaf61]|uniref:sensor histidine kinase n=1 Tax=Duganella sp. Leaf61 TaxID=1736227 RepID=UPI0006F9115C|nr:sensor histidine kinase [Duganella sp. Leaf61]KQN69381.1 histidine kinase [Duganella sp. Leaf61]